MFFKLPYAKPELYLNTKFFCLVACDQEKKHIFQAWLVPNTSIWVLRFHSFIFCILSRSGDDMKVCIVALCSSALWCFAFAPLMVQGRQVASSPAVEALWIITVTLFFCARAFHWFLGKFSDRHWLIGLDKSIFFSCHVSSTSAFKNTENPRFNSLYYFYNVSWIIAFLRLLLPAFHRID